MMHIIAYAPNWVKKCDCAYLFEGLCNVDNLQIVWPTGACVYVFEINLLT